MRYELVKRHHIEGRRLADSRLPSTASKRGGADLAIFLREGDRYRVPVANLASTQVPRESRKSPRANLLLFDRWRDQIDALRQDAPSLPVKRGGFISTHSWGSTDLCEAHSDCDPPSGDGG